MSFLTINGWSVPVKVDTANDDTHEVADRADASDGSARMVRSALKRAWSAETIILQASVAEALRGLLLGLGEYWSFDTDLYSSKGLRPIASYSVTHPGPFAKYGASAVKVNDGGSLSYEMEAPDGLWTVAVWRSPASAAGWTHYAKSADGTGYVNGVAQAFDDSWLTVGDGIVILSDPGGGSEDFVYDDLIMVPYIATAEFIAAWYGMGEAFSSLPRLKVAGDLVGGTQVICEAELPESQYRVAAGDNDRQIVSFSLVEA